MTTLRDGGESDDDGTEERGDHGERTEPSDTRMTV